MGLLHTDIVHAGVTGYDGEQFFCTVVDEDTGYLWVITVLSKSDVSEALFKLLRIELKRGFEIQTIQRDGGSEFSSLEDFTTSEGIQSRITCRYDLTLTSPYHFGLLHFATVL
jgi:hypothetical protein